MACPQCRGIARQFGDRVARRQLRRYRRSGPPKTTRMLLDAMERTGVQGASFLDVGGGVGTIQLELLARGAAGGTSVEAAPGYATVAREEALERGCAERIRYVEGDFVDEQAHVDEADFVTLDRVVCCYPDMQALVDGSAAKARRAYGLVYPRDNAVARLFVGLINIIQRLRRHPFRAFVHPTAAVEARVSSHGLERTYHAHSTIWQVALFTRRDRAPTR